MASALFDELRSFHAFLTEKIEANGSEPLSPEEALELWRIENPTPEEREATVNAVRESLEDMRAGDPGRPGREVLAEIRRKHNLPNSP